MRFRSRPVDRPAILPVLRTSQPPQPTAFPIRSTVWLAALQHGTPGIVQGVTRGGMVRVRWPDLRYVGRHRPGALVAAQESPTESPRAPQDASVGHLMRKTITSGSATRQRNADRRKLIR